MTFNYQCIGGVGVTVVVIPFSKTIQVELRIVGSLIGCNLNKPN